MGMRPIIEILDGISRNLNVREKLCDQVKSRIAGINSSSIHHRRSILSPDCYTS
jgi:hypothetical protein